MNAERLWFREKLAQRTVNALKENGIRALYVETAEEAKEMVLGMMEEGAAVGFGGSLTLEEMGLLEALDSSKKYRLVTSTGDIDADLKVQQRREALAADYYLTGTNAVTVDGRLVNIDGTGNRVASMVFGPRHVIVVAGVNKITGSLEDALARAKEEAAVMNAKRLNRRTPCATTGRCEDCRSEERICRVTTIIERKPGKTEMTVIIVGEDLGL